MESFLFLVFYYFYFISFFLMTMNCVLLMTSFYEDKIISSIFDKKNTIQCMKYFYLRKQIFF